MTDEKNERNEESTPQEDTEDRVDGFEQDSDDGDGSGTSGSVTEYEIEEAREADDEADSETIAPEVVPEDVIEQAVGVTFADFNRRHFMTAKLLRARVSNPVDFMVESLSQDEAFKSLLTSTEDSIVASNIAKIASGIALKLLEKFLASM